jgi:2-succinyl-6-hydroxy-2,4-cyclohexadiene-1-carboxylate synthase
MLEFSKLTRGDPCHPPLIFLHGFLGVKEDWEEIFPYFENQFFCIALDLPGHGSTAYSENILCALKKQMQKISVLKPILVGYSMGGRIALQLQELAEAIIVLSAHPGLADQKEKEKRKESDEIWCEKLLTLPLDLFFSEWYAQPIFHTLSCNPSLLQSIIKRRMKENSPDPNPQDLACVMRQLSLSSQPYITQFLCPTLFIHGEKDLRYRELYCNFPKTLSVRSIKNSGHAVHLENAQACAEEILNWLRAMEVHSVEKNSCPLEEC